MKISSAISVCVLAGLVGSCCCPKHAHLYRTGMAGTQVEQPADSGFPQDDVSPASRFIILGPHNPLPVVPREQEGFYSCWSTSAEMIMEYLGRHVSQCEQASRAGDNSLWCCEGGRLKHHPDCDEPNYPDFERWGFDVNQAPPLPFPGWPQVTNEIDNGRPFAFSWMRNDLNAAGSQVSHMLVVVGYTQSGGQQTRMLFCLNPRPFAVADEIMVPFSDYSGTGPPPTGIANTGVPGYIHLSDYFGIQPATPPASNQ